MEVEIFGEDGHKDAHKGLDYERPKRLSEIGINWDFKPHFGWEGHVEKERREY